MTYNNKEIRLNSTFSEVNQLLSFHWIDCSYIEINSDMKALLHI